MLNSIVDNVCSTAQNRLCDFGCARAWFFPGSFACCTLVYLKLIAIDLYKNNGALGYQAGLDSPSANTLATPIEMGI